MTQLAVPVGKDDHTLGNPKATVILLEYGDFECPNCGEAFPVVQVEERIHQNFISGVESGVNGTPTFLINGG
ncbi:MAG: DsbA family protein [Patescibacteria group bacterium]|nr:DsbA family protein [Patescibacteria group bacterium]